MRPNTMTLSISGAWQLSSFRQKATSPRYQALGAEQPIPARTDHRNELRTIGPTRTGSGRTGSARPTARSQDADSRELRQACALPRLGSARDVSSDVAVAESQDSDHA